MATKAVFCIAGNEAQASEIICQLKLAGFLNDDISALLPDKTGTRDFAHERHSKAPEGAVLCGLLGGAFCAAAGWLLAIGLFSVPALAHFGSDPVVAALSGAGFGGVAGGIIGALAGLAVPEYEARRYEGKVQEGNILLSVHCANQQAVQFCSRLFRAAGARDIGVTRETQIEARAPSAIPVPVPEQVG
jgi:hypothetical protein